MSDWVKVKDGLPNETETVLVLCANTHINPVRITFGIYFLGRWLITINGETKEDRYAGYRVTYWCRLPEKPEVDFNYNWVE